MCYICYFWNTRRKNYFHLGETRLSDFLLWQASNCVTNFVEVLFPSFVLSFFLFKADPDPHSATNCFFPHSLSVPCLRVVRTFFLRPTNSQSVSHKSSQPCFNFSLSPSSICQYSFYAICSIGPSIFLFFSPYTVPG